MPAEDSGRAEGAPSPTLSLSPQQRQQLAELAAAVKEGRSPGRRKQRLTTEELSARAHAYCDSLTPQARRIHTLSARIATGEASKKELAELLAQLEQQQNAAAERCSWLPLGGCVVF